ncbi:carbohydrate ABC transporter membrane protein 2 (CUT1 family) [Aliiruegeria haliotis]|uniref:Carbohydrate ABC transporter membrane protein 2 (CUT1 family) n=1 Tax=Aliiruegeria haliotis TaxID=1280846 RepID=A0A2T0RED8_9RHOB|nr:carbohydrate ABC transporter permease [Aliiruegeria haliotis]PRY19528.1 carbohydrate ABC transporter membrane protein 2 (CUT1 family) [Aliiruegeria haliotis]
MAIVQSRSRSAIAWQITKYSLLSIGAIIMVVPFIDMFLGALRTPAERLARPPVYWPQDPQWINFKRVFTETPALIWFKNSIFITLSVTFIQLLTSSMAGYALAKYKFRGSNLLFRGVLGAQMFPFFLFIIPIFFILRYFPLAGGNSLFGQGGSGFLNTYVAIILPFAITWYGIFLMRQFFMGVPDELLDAARLDGAGEFKIFFIIVLPLVLPGLATLGIFVFVYQWNEVIWTMTVTRTAPDLQTLPVGIYLLRGAFTEEATQSLQQAAVAVSIIPVMVAFLLLQRFYVRGLTAGSVKG